MAQESRRGSARRAASQTRRRRVIVAAGVGLAGVALLGAAILGVRAALATHGASKAALAARTTSAPRAHVSAPTRPASAASSSTDASPAPVANPATDQAVPVLMYHHIMPQPSNFIAISTSTFDAQMRYLHDHAWHPISMAQFQAFVLTGKRLPSKPVLITFDDGRVNQLKYGVPILKKYDFTATFFVVKKWIDSPSVSFMHETQLKELIADGYDLESHTTNHMMLYRFHSKSTGRYETYPTMKGRMWNPTNGMRVWMDATLGVSPVTALAYPGGGFDADTRRLVQEAGYQLAFTTNDGYVTYQGQSQYALPRWNTGARGTSQSTFISILNGALRHKRTK